MFLLDANIFIQHNNFNPIDIHIGMWDLLTNGHGDITLGSIIPVYNEINKRHEKPKDKALCSWAKEQKEKGYFMKVESAGIQQEYSKVVNYVMNTYNDTESRKEFLDKADPWLIAVALHYNYKIISYEKSSNGSMQKVKIPDVAEHFNIICLDFHDFCRQYNIKFSVT